MTILVAEITTDHLWEKWNNEGGEYNSISHKGKEFHYEAMKDWWGWEDQCLTLADLPATKTEFKLYDDDYELYYSGWLLNDDWCTVQQFVLRWAEADSGCTHILINHPSAGFVQEI